MHQFHLGRGNLLVSHGTVAGAKIDSAGRRLADAAARTNGLIVDLNSGMLSAVFTKPFGVDGFRKGRSSRIQLLCKTLGRHANDRRSQKQAFFHYFPLVNLRALSVVIVTATLRRDEKREKPLALNLH